MILCRLAKCCDASIFALAAKFHLEPYDVVCSSITCIKDSFCFYFSKLDSHYYVFLYHFVCVIVSALFFLPRDAMNPRY